MRLIAPILSLLLLAACGGTVDVGKGEKRGVAAIDGAATDYRLQIIVTYDDSRSTHAALRLQHPRRGTLFWDPAGSFGLVATDGLDGWENSSVSRRNDLVETEAPSLSAYWRFAMATDDTAMEVFEWVLTEERADEAYDVLRMGAEKDSNEAYDAYRMEVEDGGHAATEFRTVTPALYCSVSVSHFLNRYFGELTQVTEDYFWPSDLAAHLRTRRPDRSLVYSIEKPEYAYVVTPGDIRQSRAGLAETPSAEY